jgi:hypothetical protein
MVPPVIASRDHELGKDRFGKMPRQAGGTPTLPETPSPFLAAVAMPAIRD